MDIKEVEKMGNQELVISFRNLCHQLGIDDVKCKKMVFVDEDLYMDIHILEEEIMLRMSRDYGNWEITKDYV